LKKQMMIKKIKITKKKMLKKCILLGVPAEKWAPVKLSYAQAAT